MKKKKTFKELFANTGIEPTKDENGEIKQFKFDENVARACLQYVIAKALEKNKKKSK
jgi:hypothetical protein